MAPRTRDELLSYGVMNPLMAAELEVNPLRAPAPSDPYYGRDDFLAAREHRATRLRERHHLRYIPGPVKEVKEKYVKICVRDGSEILVRIYTPAQGTSQTTPLIVMFHEGGWSMGDLTDEEVNCRMFTRDIGAVCVNVDYRLAPEHRFPTGINDCWDALLWTAKNTNSLGAHPSAGFIVGGGSAGGNIAAVLAHLARDENLQPPLTGQYLCVPAVMCLLPPDSIPEKYRGEYLSHPMVTPSQDPVLQGDATSTLKEVLQPDYDSPLFVPFHFGKQASTHKDLPPAYLQVCGLDPLRDEGLIYERVLREESGVETKLDLYPGYGHYFWTNFPKLEMSQRFVEDTLKGIRWLLSRLE